MNIKMREEGGAVIIQADGRLDATTVGEFEASHADLLEKRADARVILDLSRLEYISSAGLRSFLSLAKKLKEGGGSIALCSLSGIVKEVVKLAGFDQFLPVYEDLTSALQSK